MLYVSTIASYTEVLWAHNVVVAHEKEGRVDIHLPSGHTLTMIFVICTSLLVMY